MNIYRVTRRKHADALDGEGSRLNGGRWNHPGTPCIYASENRALPVLELLANTFSEDTPEDLVIVTLSIPDSESILSPHKLPEHWKEIVVTDVTRDFGTELLKKAEHLLIRLPSVIIPQEYNYIINPLHPGIKKVVITDISDFSFDARLKK